jgi:hypothetical protein
MMLLFVLKFSQTFVIFKYFQVFKNVTEVTKTLVQLF